MNDLGPEIQCQIVLFTYFTTSPLYFVARLTLNTVLKYSDFEKQINYGKKTPF